MGTHTTHAHTYRNCTHAHTRNTPHTAHMSTHMHASHTHVWVHTHTVTHTCPHAHTCTSPSDWAALGLLAALRHEDSGTRGATVAWMGERVVLCHPGPLGEVAEGALEPRRAPCCPPLSTAMSGWPMARDSLGGQGGPGTCGVSACDAGALAAPWAPWPVLWPHAHQAGCPLSFIGPAPPSSVPAES